MVRPVHAFVSAAPFADADGIVRIVCVADRDQPLVIARMEVSELEGESTLLAHRGTSLKELCQSWRSQGPGASETSLTSRLRTDGYV